MKPIGQLDTSHAIYQPDKQAKRTRHDFTRRAEQFQTERANETEVEPNFHGSTAQKEAWMRQKQAMRTAKIEADRERQMLAEAESHLARKRTVCQCNIEQIKARLRSDPGLRAMLTRGLEEC